VTASTLLPGNIGWPLGIPVIESLNVPRDKIFIFTSNGLQTIYAHSIEDLNWRIKLGGLLKDMRTSLNRHLDQLVADTERRLFG